MMGDCQFLKQNERRHDRSDSHNRSVVKLSSVGSQWRHLCAVAVCRQVAAAAARTLRACASRQWRAAKEFAESFPEVAIEERVDEWVEGRVQVSDPKEESDNYGRGGAALAAHGRRQVPGEKREPAEEKRSHDYAQGLGRFVFALDLLPVLCQTVTVASGPVTDST